MKTWRRVLTVGLALWVSIVSLQGQSLYDLTLIQEQVTGFGVGADVRVKLVDRKQLRGKIQVIDDESFELAQKRDGKSAVIAYDQIAELRLVDLYYQAKGSPDPTEARRTVVGLGVG